MIELKSNFKKKVEEMLKQNSIKYLPKLFQDVKPKITKPLLLDEELRGPSMKHLLINQTQHAVLVLYCNRTSSQIFSKKVFTNQVWHKMCFENYASRIKENFNLQDEKQEII